MLHTPYFSLNFILVSLHSGLSRPLCHSRSAFFLLFLSFYINLILIHLFLFFVLSSTFSLTSFASLLHVVSVYTILHYHFLVRFFHFVFSHTTSSLYLLNSLNLLDTHRNSCAEMDFHSLRVILAYDGLRT